MDRPIKEKQGSFTIPYYVLGQRLGRFSFLTNPLDGLVVTPFEAPYQEHFERWKLNAEKALFYGSVNLQQSESLFTYTNRFIGLSFREISIKS